MKRTVSIQQVDAETAGTMRLLGFVADSVRTWTHAELCEAGSFDATAIADEHVLAQAVLWMEKASTARGRAQLRAEIREILG